MWIALVQSLSHVRLLATPWTTALQASLSFTISQSLLRLMSIESVMASNHLILSPLSPSAPASRSFPISWLFMPGGQSIGTSALASVLPRNIQGWLPLGVTGLISLSKGLLRVFYSTTIQKHQIFSSKPFLWSLFHICTWPLEKTIALTIRILLAKTSLLLIRNLGLS